MILNRTASASSWLPVAALLAFYAEIVFVRLWSGAWPNSGAPQHADVAHELPVIDALVSLAVATGLLLSPILLVLLLAISHVSRRRVARRVLVRFVLARLALVACLRIDPGRFVDWFLD